MKLWNPLSPDNIKDPYPMYESLRTRAPIFRAHTGEWVVTGYSDVKAILKDNRFKAGNKKDWIERGVTYFKSKDQDFTAIAKAINSFVLLINPPEHGQIRRFIMEAWKDHEVEQLISENVQELILPIKSLDSFDAVETFTSRLPALTISKILGVPVDEYVRLRNAGRQLIKVINPYISYKELVLMNKAAKEFIDFFRELITQKTKIPEDDLVSNIVRLNKKSNETLSENQLISICIFLFIAGEETTISFLSTTILNIGLNSKLKTQLTKRLDSFSDKVIDELLRYDGPVHLLGRIAHNDFEYGGYNIRKNDVITLCLASANRDQKQFDRPNEIDIDRYANKHLAFGQGTHFCLGDWIARKQAKIGLTAFLNTFPNYSVSTRIEWNDNLSIRSPKELRVQI